MQWKCWGWVRTEICMTNETRTTRWKLVLGTILIFLAGLLIGLAAR